MKPDVIYSDAINDYQLEMVINLELIPFLNERSYSNIDKIISCIKYIQRKTYSCPNRIFDVKDKLKISYCTLVNPFYDIYFYKNGTISLSKEAEKHLSKKCPALIRKIKLDKWKQ